MTGDDQGRAAAGNRSARRAAQVLKVLGECGMSMGVSQISRELDVSPPTVYRLLVALKAEGLVDQNPDTQKYGISVELFALGRAAVRSMGFGERVREELSQLAQRVGETVNFGVIRRNRVIYLQSIESEKPLRAGVKVGSMLPAHVTAIGKVILAYSGSEAVEDYLEQVPLEPHTPASVVDADTLRKRLAQIKKDGFTLDDEECHVGVRAVGAPLHDGTGQVIAGIAITGPSTRLTDDGLPSLVSELTATARTISRQLGYFEEYSSEVSPLSQLGVS
ncbi:MAG: IclR family transcriptional regulator [Anaerolineales bacterium]